MTLKFMELMEPRVLFALVIAVLFLIGFLSAIGNIVRYATHETGAIENVATRLRNAVAPEGQPSAPEATPADPATPDNNELLKTAAEEHSRTRRLIPISILIEGLAPRSMIADRLRSIEKLRAAHTKINVNALQQMTLAREAASRWLAWPGYIANVCMMIGLFGTVFGLSQVLREVGHGLPAEHAEITFASLKATANQIRGVLSGMSTAFSATIAGLIASIVLSWLNQQLSGAQAKVLNLLDRFTFEELLPATVPVTDDESLLERISLQLEASFARLDDTLQTNRELLEQLGTVEKSLIEIVNGVRDSRTANESGRGVPELVGPLTGVIEQIAQMNRTVANVTSTLPSVLQEAQRANTATLDRLDRAIARPKYETVLSPTLRITLGCMATLNLVVVLVLLLR